MHNAQEPLPFRAPNDIFRYTTKELLNITPQFTTNKVAAGPLTILGSREAVPSSSRAASSSIAIRGTKKYAKGGKKRREWHPQPQWVAATTDYDDDDKHADNSIMECIVTAGHSIKHKA
jgi:Fe-S-cluster formation regulator IscX/YfhJ